MSLIKINFPGKSIGLATSMHVLIPDNISRKKLLPTFYLLHGLSDDDSIWLRKTSIERYVQNLPLIVVMPTTARNWYTNSLSDPVRAYEDHIIKDVLPLIDNTFPTLTARTSRAIGGLSMGGYGAVKLALKYPHLFSSGNSHSGALSPFQNKPNENDTTSSPEFLSIFGPSAKGSDNDPHALAKKCPKKLRPKLLIDCGAADFLLTQNRQFHAALTALNYPHTYTEIPVKPTTINRGPLSPWTAAHDWNYWDHTIQSALLFHCKNLKILLPRGS